MDVEIKQATTVETLESVMPKTSLFFFCSCGTSGPIQANGRSPGLSVSGIEQEEVRRQDATAAFTQEMEVETRIAPEPQERPWGAVACGGLHVLVAWQ